MRAGRPRFVSDKLTTEADARELWLLAHKYEVDGVKEWLLKHGITADSVCAAASFACECVADVCDGLLEACRELASVSLPKVRESALCGVSADAALELLRAHAENEHLGRACDVGEGFRYVQRWARANEVLAVENKTIKKEAKRLTGTLELSLLPASFLLEHVRTSGLVSNDKLWQMQEELLKAERVANRFMRLGCVCKLSASLPEGRRFVSLGLMSIGGRGPKQRVAVLDTGACCVYVFRLEDMKLLWVAGSTGQGPGQFMEPAGSAFDGRGHLFVSDEQLNNVQEFDCEGEYVRCFGKQGSGPGELSRPWGISVSAQGDILVCDEGNHRVQVFDGDGRFVRVVPSPDDPQQVRLRRPSLVFAAADGNMIVRDQNCVRVFSRDGLFVKEIKPPHVQGEHWKVFGMCAGPRGELVAIESDTQTVRVLDADGALLWTAKCNEESKAWDTAMDWKGQLLFKPSGISDVYLCKPEPCEAS